MVDLKELDLKAAIIGYEKIFALPADEFAGEVDPDERAKLIKANFDLFIRRFNDTYDGVKAKYQAEYPKGSSSDVFIWISEYVNTARDYLGLIPGIRKNSEYGEEAKLLGSAFACLFSTLEFAIADRRFGLLYKIEDKKTYFDMYIIDSFNKIKENLKALGIVEKPSFLVDRVNQIKSKPDLPKECLEKLAYVESVFSEW